MSYKDRDQDNSVQVYDPNSGRNLCVIGPGSSQYQGRTWVVSRGEAIEHGRALLAKTGNANVEEFLIVRVIARVRRATQVEVIDVT